MSNCPCPEQLQRWLADQLGSPLEQAVAAHVETCPNCQQALERLTGAAAARNGPEARSGRESGADFLCRLGRKPPAGAWTTPGPKEPAQITDKLSGVSKPLVSGQMTVDDPGAPRPGEPPAPVRVALVAGSTPQSTREI